MSEGPFFIDKSFLENMKKEAFAAGFKAGAERMKGQVAEAIHEFFKSERSWLTKNDVFTLSKFADVVTSLPVPEVPSGNS